MASLARPHRRSAGLAAVLACTLAGLGACHNDKNKGTPLDTGNTGLGSSSGSGATTGTSASGGSFTTASTQGSADASASAGTTSNPATTGVSTSSTTAPGTTAVTTMTSNGSTGSGMCQADPNEPNDSPDAAHDLGMITDSDSDGSTVMGVLDGPDDTDWFTYHGSDTISGMVDPTRALTTDGNVALCKYVLCDTNPDTQTLICPQGTMQAMASNGAPGCCAMGMGFTIDITCDTFTDDSGTIWIELATDDMACVNYSLDYHF